MGSNELGPYKSNCSPAIEGELYNYNQIALLKV
jgi:hypothetical protein